MSDTIPQDISQKQCNRCKKYLSAIPEFFTHDRSKKDGWRTICKVCDKTPKEALPPPPEGYKRCRTCNQIKPATTDFFNATAPYASEDCLNRQCKNCRKEYRKEHNIDKSKQIYPQSEFKQCRGTCKKTLPCTLDYFNYNKATKDRLCTICKECSKENMMKYHHRPGGKEARQAWAKRRSEYLRNYRKTYRVLHWEHEQAYRKWYNQTHKAVIKARTSAYTRSEHGRAVKLAATHRRLARKRNIPGTHTPQQIQELLKRQRYHCYYCGKKFEKKNGKYVFHRDHTFPLNRGNSSNDISLIVLTCPPCNLSKGDRYPWEWVQGGRLL